MPSRPESPEQISTPKASAKASTKSPANGADRASENATSPEGREDGPEIVVRGKNVALNPDVTAVTEAKLARLRRFAHDVSRVEVDYSEIRSARVGDNQICEVTVRLKRHFVKAHARAATPTAALDLVVAKLERTLARVKGKRVGRSHPRRRLASLPPLEEFETLETSVDRADDDADDALARVVKTKRFTLKPMTVEEATLQLELLGHAFYLFVDADRGSACVLYRRRDGHLGMIEAVG